VDNSKELSGSAEVHRFPSRARKPSGRDPRVQAAVDFYFTGDNYTEALSQFFKLVDDGFGEANLFLAYIYEQGGPGVVQDLEKALFYYQKAAETFGAVEGYLGVARLRYFGKGVPQDYDQAFKCYSFVENEIDNGIAFHMLGRMYQHGHGVKKSASRAREYYQKAIDEGFVMGMVSLGQLEQESGKFLKGWYLRIKGGILAFKLALKDRQDTRLRGW
jgi:TPR repeat protein